MSTIRTTVAVCGLFIAGGAMAPHAWSQGAPNWPPPASNVMPAPAPSSVLPAPSGTAKYDAMLENKDYTQLGLLLSRLSLSEMPVSVKWQNDNIIAGKSAFLGFTYVRDLWRTAVSIPMEKYPVEQALLLKQMAVQILLYTYQLIALDGVKCQDASAPAKWADQIFTAFPYVWNHVATLSDEERTRIINTVLGLEKATAPKRSDDEFICLNEAARVDALMKKNAWLVEKSASDPPAPGKKIEVPAELDYKVKFVSKEVWLTKQAAIRAAMPADLRKIMERYKTPPDQKAPNAAR